MVSFQIFDEFVALGSGSRVRDMYKAAAAIYERELKRTDVLNI